MSKDMSGLPNLPINLNIDYDATNLVDSTVTKVAGTATSTLTALWFVTFGWLDHYADKVRIKRAANLKEYQTLVNKEISKILPEHLMEPRVSILGPAIQSSEFYFEEEHYREMFAKLIASSMDSSKQNSAHTSFVDIIKQLSPVDATLFSAISLNRDIDIGSIPISKIMITGGKNISLGRKLKDLLVIPHNLENTTSCDISASLNNLNRLGLIDISYTKFFTDNGAYSYLDKNSLVIEYRSDSSNPEFQLEHGILELTTFGYSFASVCL